MAEKLYYSELIIGSAAIILLLGISFLFTSQKRNYRFYKEKLLLKNNFDRELLTSQLEIQTQAFETISRELHDNVGTLLSIAMVHIQSLTEVSATEQLKVKEAHGLLNEAMDSLRDISKSIHPENIGRLGWKQSFIEELERVRKTNIFSVAYTEEGEPVSIELRKEVILFRILQESLNNIVKHSGGTHIEVQVRFSENEVAIKIEDDGKGLQKALPELTKQGSGIGNMLARAAMMPASLQIEKGKEKGTIVSILYKEPST